VLRIHRQHTATHEYQYDYSILVHIFFVLVECTGHSWIDFIKKPIVLSSRTIGLLSFSLIS